MSAVFNNDVSKLLVVKLLAAVMDGNSWNNAPPSILTLNSSMTSDISKSDFEKRFQRVQGGSSSLPFKNFPLPPEAPFKFKMSMGY